MRTVRTLALAFSSLLVLASVAHAQATLNSARIGAMDSVALAKFYESAFGMQETNRLGLPAGPEIFLNFGATAVRLTDLMAERLRPVFGAAADDGVIPPWSVLVCESMEER